MPKEAPVADPTDRTSMDDLTPPYGTIVVDPPWRYTNDRGTQTRSRAGRASTVAEGNYSTMSNAEIAALPVGDLAAPECALYLWVTNPRMFGHVNRHRDPIAPIDLVKSAVAHLAGDRSAPRPDGMPADTAPTGAGEVVVAAEQLLAVLPHAVRICPEAGRLARAVANHKET